MAKSCGRPAPPPRTMVINMYVKTDPAAHYRKGMSLFLVDNTTPGLDVRKLDMLGRRCTGTYEIFRKDVRVPADRFVGESNKGWEVRASGLQVERTVAAAGSCGGAQRGRRFGIAIRQGTQAVRTSDRHLPGDRAHARRYADRGRGRALLMWRAACDGRQGQDATARDHAWPSCSALRPMRRSQIMGMQVLGGYGYNMEFDMQRHYRDSRGCHRGRGLVADAAQPDRQSDGSQGAISAGFRAERGRVVMDCRFTEEQSLLRDTVAKLMAKHAPPEFMRPLDREQSYPYALYDAWVEAGLLAHAVSPKNMAGSAAARSIACIIAEEISRTSADIAMADRRQHCSAGSMSSARDRKRKSGTGCRNCCPARSRCRSRCRSPMPARMSARCARRRARRRPLRHQRPETLGDRRRRERNVINVVC